MGNGKTAGALFPVVRCLSIHADYACRHSGACCTAGWRIPIDEEQRRILTAACHQGRLSATAPVLPVMPAMLAMPAMDTSPCAFFVADTRLCAIHRDLGAEHKPPSCRHFPRVALLDARGVSLTLSHFCPTAAAMLFREDVSLAVLHSPLAFPVTAEYEGLDARDVLPPLLRPGLLWDLDGYSAWEEQAVSFLGTTRLRPDAALSQLGRVAGAIQEWTPGNQSLRAHVIHAFGVVGALDEQPRRGKSSDLPGGEHGRVVNRYLAARLFASWIPYRADRLAALIDHLEETRASLEEESGRIGLLEAIRATDLRVVHGS
jgi:Fe-S-cluster containining protein